MSARLIQSNKQGRPPKDGASRIRTLAWFRAVRDKTGKTSVELGREFHPVDYCYDGEKQKTSHRWERYETGANSPTDDDTGSSLIDVVEGKYPETAYWFRHVIWTALGQRIQSSATISSMLAGLDKSVIDICFVPQEARDKATLTRMPYDYGIPTRLSYLRSLDGLAALLLLANEAELIGNGRMHAQVMMRVSHVLFHLKGIPQFFNVLPEIFEYLKGRIASFKYHMIDNIVLPAAEMTLGTIMGDGKDLWPEDEYTALEHQLLEQFQRLFGDASIMRNWLLKPHPLLGEAPMDALRHPQGIDAIRMLLKC